MKESKMNHYFVNIGDKRKFFKTKAEVNKFLKIHPGTEIVFQNKGGFVNRVMFIKQI